jgi:hypothetical protein
MSTPEKNTTAGSTGPTDPAIQKARDLGVQYQQAGQVRQLLAERQNAVAYGMLDRIVGIDRSLSEMGYTGDRTVGSSGDPGPLGRASRSDKTVQAETPTTNKSGSGITSSFMGPKPPQTVTAPSATPSTTAAPDSGAKPA